MFHRVWQRIRRRIPGRTAGYQGADRADDDTEERTSLDVPCPARLPEKVPSGDHTVWCHARELIWHVDAPQVVAPILLQSYRSRESAEAAAWSRLDHIYALFVALQDAPEIQVPGDQGLRSLIAPLDANEASKESRLIFRDWENRFGGALPEGFSAEMFQALGDVIYEEMVREANEVSAHRQQVQANHQSSNSIQLKASSPYEPMDGGFLGLVTVSA